VELGHLNIETSLIDTTFPNPPPGVPVSTPPPLETPFHTILLRSPPAEIHRGLSNISEYLRYVLMASFHHVPEALYQLQDTYYGVPPLTSYKFTQEVIFKRDDFFVEGVL